MLSTLDDFAIAEKEEDELNDSVGNLMCRILQKLFLWQTVNFLSDSALESLIYLIKSILELINSLFFFGKLAQIISVFPDSLYKARKIAGVDRDNFQKHVVCPKCDSTYEYNECFVVCSGIFSYIFLFIFLFKMFQNNQLKIFSSCLTLFPK